MQLIFKSNFKKPKLTLSGQNAEMNEDVFQGVCNVFRRKSSKLSPNHISLNRRVFRERSDELGEF